VHAKIQTIRRRQQQQQQQQQRLTNVLESVAVKIMWEMDIVMITIIIVVATTMVVIAAERMGNQSNLITVIKKLDVNA